MLIDCALVKNKIPDATVKRLALYLSCVSEFDNNKARVSSEKLAKLAKVNPAQVRRDLSYLGTLGKRGVGYEISTLKNQLMLELGLVKGWRAVIVGTGNLGSALAHYVGFEDKGFGIVGLYDADAKKISSKVAGLEVKPIQKIYEDIKKNKVAIFCTGGIRCEKAAVLLDRFGFNQVIQLDGGILNYMNENLPNSKWKGKCFVFDDRITID